MSPVLIFREASLASRVDGQRLVSCASPSLRFPANPICKDYISVAQRAMAMLRHQNIPRYQVRFQEHRS